MSNNNSLILQCPRCRFVWTWDRISLSEPENCQCGAWAPWRVLDKMPEPGYVKVISVYGWQELKGPYWQEDPKWMD